MSRGYDLNPFLMAARDRVAQHEAMRLAPPTPVRRRWRRSLVLALTALALSISAAECSRCADRQASLRGGDDLARRAPAGAAHR